MAKTKIADVIVPELFAPYALERMVDRWALFSAGIISADPRIGAMIGDGGQTIQMPFWGDLTSAGASQILSDSNALVPNKISASKDIAVINFRGQAWSANDLSFALAGSDPMSAIADQTSDYWIYDMGTMLQNMLLGLLNDSGTLNATHVHDYASEDYDNETTQSDFHFTDAHFLTAAYKLGEHNSRLQTLVVHSTIEKQMLSADLIQYVNEPSGAPARIPTYRGRRVIVDDNVPTVAGTTTGTKYFSILFGPGAIGWGEVTPEHAAETDRDSLASDDYLIHRRTFVLHPRGVKWVGTAAGTSPTNAELATVGNWTKVYSNANVPIVALVCNG